MNIPESAIRYWSKALAEESFDSEVEARARVFDLCERHAAESWITQSDEVTVVKHRNFANAMPLHQSGGKWKIGLKEYLSNCTSDFSDGTNGEPSGYPPSGGGVGSVPGLPDYKYLDQQKMRRSRLQALRQRRDPEGISNNPVDKQIARVLGEATEGGPITAYHSSPYQFKKFDTSREGAHFGTFEQASNLRKAGKKEPKAYTLDIKNPLRMHDIGVWNNFNNFHGALSIGGHITDEQADAVWAAWQQSDNAGWESLKQALEQNGYDGIVYKNEQEGPGDSYIAFRPEQIRPAKNIRESGEDDEEGIVKDVEFEPTPSYSGLPEYRFGWALDLGTEEEIKERAAKSRIRLKQETWDLINDQFVIIEKNVLRGLNSATHTILREEGHSEDSLIGSGWIRPDEDPKLWRVISNDPTWVPKNLLDFGFLTGLTPDAVYADTHPIMRKLLIPMFYIFDIQPRSCPECKSNKIIETGTGSKQCENCGHIWTP